MKFFAVVIKDKNSVPTKEEINQDLGIQIEHNGKRYSVSEDNHGKIVITSLNGCLQISPKSSNRIEVDSE